MADKFEQSGLDGLSALGVEVDYRPDLKAETLATALRETQAEVLVVRSTQVTSDMFDADGHLALVIRAGAGYNTIDVAAASEHGIYVANCPGKNSQAVAELAFGLMIAVDRHIADCVGDIKAGRWNKKKYSRSKGLFGRTLGLVGMGNIGQEMIVRAKAFGMNVVAFSRWMTPETAAALGVGRAASLREVAAMSDFISVHVSLTPETRGMLSQEFFSAMRQGAIFINTSRAEVVDEGAMAKAIAEKGIGVGLDVFAGEPDTAEGEVSCSLINLENVVVTHHIGASTDQAQEAVAEETVRIVREFKATGDVPNVINVTKGEKGSHVLAVRHAERVGVTGRVFELLTSSGVAISEMERISLGTSKAVIVQISIDKEPEESLLDSIRHIPGVFDASVFGA